MITPWFKIDQNDEFVIITIKAKHVKISADSEPEIHIENFEFKFFCNPYYLRLHFTHSLVEDGREKAEYNDGYFIIKVPKLNYAENFEDLHMLTKLLTPYGKTSAAAPNIEAIEGEIIEEEEEEEEEFNWHIEQKINIEDVSIKLPKYGFAHTREGVFKNLQHYLGDVIDLKNADSVKEEDRKIQKTKQEEECFDEEHYLADLYETDMIEHLIKYKPPWIAESKHLEIHKFTDDEEEALLKLPRKQYILDKRQKRIAFLSLVDIIYAYAYDYRTTEAENSVESGWTICKLSSTLSWLDYFEDFTSVVISCIRRSLIFPLYRNFSLSIVVLKDVIAILKRGREYVISRLLHLKSLLLDQDDHYLLNQLYIDDYCCWLQSCQDKPLYKIANRLDEVIVSKDDLTLNLIELEQAAELLLFKKKDKNRITVIEAIDDSDDDEIEECVQNRSTDDEDNGLKASKNEDFIDQKNIDTCVDKINTLSL